MITGSDNRNLKRRVQQKRIIELMQLMGYQPNRDGVCFGISHMAMLEMLSGKIKFFDERIERLSNESVQKLGEKIYNGTYTSDETILEYMKFFRGISLYMDPKKHVEVIGKKEKPINQDEKLVTPLVMPEELKKEKGVVNLIEFAIPNKNSFCGMYSQDDLISYLNSFSSMINGLNATCTRPIALNLGSPNHAIVISYDPHAKEWMFLDPEDMPTQFLKSDDTKALADKIQDAFKDHKSKTSSHYITFSTSIYCTGNDSLHLKEPFKNWYTESQKSFHLLTKEKATTIDMNHACLLHLAVKDNDKELVENILSLCTSEAEMKSIINATLKDGMSPLIYAAQFGHHDLARLLIQLGADVNHLKENNTTALHLALNNSDHDMIDLLLRNNAHLTQDKGISPLYYVFFICNDEKIINTFIDHLNNQDIDTFLDENRLTPLSALLLHEKYDLALKLIDQGASVHAALIDGTTPIDFIVNQIIKDGESFQLFEPILNKMFASLKQDYLNGKSINFRLNNEDNYNLLHLAVQVDDRELVGILIEQLKKDRSSVDCNHKSTNGFTPLMLAIMLENDKIAKDLLNIEHIDVDAPDINGETPLYYAAKQGNHDLITLLLKNGADPNVGCIRNDREITDKINSIKFAMNSNYKPNLFSLSTKTEPVVTDDNDIKNSLRPK